MKHPRFEVLQDYFENVLNPYHENIIKEHLLECDVCTKMLSHFATIETKLTNQKVVPVSDNTRKKIFLGAQQLLSAKKVQKNAKELRKEKILEFWAEWKEIIFPQIKIPILQLSSLSLVLIVLVTIEKNQGGEEEMYVPLADSVQVLTYADIAQKAEE